MSIAHHPELRNCCFGLCVSGAANEGVGLLISQRIWRWCPECRAAVGKAEAAGGVMLSQLAPEPMGNGARWKKFCKGWIPKTKICIVLNKGATRAPTKTPFRSLCAPIWAWRFRPRGLAEGGGRHLACSAVPAGRTRGSSLSARHAGTRAVATHTHRGEELTLVLAGGFSDATGTYARGDVQTASPDILHRPKADPGEDCINLAVTDGAR